MFENSLIGAYYNRLYELKERDGTFSCYGRIKANSAGKNLNVTNINTNAVLPNCQIGLLLNSSFFNCQNDHHLGDAISCDCVSPPLHFQKLRMVVVSSFFLFEHFQSSLTDQHDYQYMYRSYGLYLQTHFVVAFTNVCTVKLAQLL